jgi:DNA-directed RNA polymerase specialized sigma subunit
MDITTPEITNIVWYWAWYVCRSCRQHHAPDVAQELWIEALEAAERWTPEGRAAFSSFIYGSLKWKALKIVRDEYRKVEAERRYAQLEHRENHAPPQHESVESVFRRVKSKIENSKSKSKSTTLRVLDVLTNPPQDLFHVAMDYAGHRKDYCGRATHTIKNLHIAYYVGCSDVDVSRAVNKIKEVLESEDE